MANRFCSSVVSGSLGLMTTVPSQAIPSNPVPTLSRTPSSTDVSTTSAKTPSMSSVSVRADRSLCDHSSTRPPRDDLEHRGSGDGARARRASRAHS